MYKIGTALEFPKMREEHPQRHYLKEFSNTKVIVNTIEELVTKEILSRRSFGRHPLQHQLEEALQFFIMLKNGKAMTERLLSMWAQFRRTKTYLVGVCKYGPPATCFILTARRRGTLDIEGRPSAISTTVAPRDQISMAVVYGFPFITSGAIHNGVPTDVRCHVRSGVSFTRKDIH